MRYLLDTNICIYALKHRPIGDLDSLIAAQALARAMVLVSNNLREFERVPGLKTENWVA